MDPGVAVSLTVLALVLWGIPIIFVVSDPIISKKEKTIWVFACLLYTSDAADDFAVV